MAGFSSGLKKHACDNRCGHIVDAGSDQSTGDKVFMVVYINRIVDTRHEAKAGKTNEP
jgi:hypothetical protein